MNAKEFCQIYGIPQNDALWICKKFSKENGDAKHWYSLIHKDIAQIPQSLQSALQVFDTPETAKEEETEQPKPKKGVSK